MAVLFASDTFLPSMATGENFLKIRDTAGAIRYKIYNNTVASSYVNLDTIVIKTDADSKTINLKFGNNPDAQSALVKLQAALLKIKDNYLIQKDSKFSDISFEIYNDLDAAMLVKFDLNDLSAPKTVTFGEGTVLQTEVEALSVLNNETQFRFFEHFMKPHQLAYGTFGTGFTKYHENEIGHAGILEMTLNTESDVYLWSATNSIQLNDSAVFSINFRVTTLSDVNDNYRIAMGFFNKNNGIASISKGAYFLFDYALNSNWLVKSIDSTSTIQNTMTAVDTNWHTFSTRFNIAHELEFLIDNEIVSTIDTNVPTGFGSEVSFGVVFEKADVAHPTSILIDWIKFEINL